MEDPTAALLAGATVTLDDAAPISANSVGHFSFVCVVAGPHTLRASMKGFGDGSVSTSAPHRGEIRIKLAPSTQVKISVQADDQGSTSAGGTQGMTITGNQLQALADDPDDLLRELQQMGAAAGGSPINTTISVDGFQGDSALPPKDSIAYINVEPDMFSAEYRERPSEAAAWKFIPNLERAPFTAHSSVTIQGHWMNAQDPFSKSNGSIGKQRYGFDLSGPVLGKHSNFRISL